MSQDYGGISIVLDLVYKVFISFTSDSAPGSFQNIVSNTHIIVNPGTWSSSIPTPPTTSPTAWIDPLTLGIITHLPTIQGLIVTTSLYPTAPTPTPAPGIINWTGYSIPG